MSDINWTEFTAEKFRERLAKVDKAIDKVGSKRELQAMGDLAPEKRTP